MATNRIIVAGFGGQGVLLIGQLIAYTAMFDNKEVTWMPTYGPEMRGGTANCTVCVSDKPISSPVGSTCDILVAMNGPSLEKFEPMLKPGGHLFINSSSVTIAPKRDDVNIHYVDTLGIAAKEIGNEKTTNMVMLGAMLRTCDIVNIDIIDQTLEYVMKGEKAKFIPDNKRAIMAWKED